MSQTQRILVILSAIIVVLALVFGGLFWASSPSRAAAKIEKALQKQDNKSVEAMIPEWVGPADRDDIQFFLDDWAEAGVPTVSVEGIDAWRTRPATDATQKEEAVPTPRYWAHNANVSMVVSFDDFEDPVVVTLTRKTPNTWSIFSQLFRGWELTGISYQTDGDTEDAGDVGIEEEVAAEESADESVVNTNADGSEASTEEGAESEEIIVEEGEEEVVEDETSNANGEAESTDGEEEEEGEVEIFDAGLIEQ